MNVLPVQHEPSDARLPEHDGDLALSGAMTSVAFWLCLFAAVGLYAMVVLSPKAVNRWRQADQFAANQQRLLALRQQIDVGERLAREWESNPELVMSLERLSAAEPMLDGELIAVEDALRYRGVSQTPTPITAATSSSMGRRLVEFVATSRFVRIGGLLGSAVLLVVGFTFLLTDRSAEGHFPASTHQ